MVSRLRHHGSGTFIADVSDVVAWWELSLRCCGVVGTLTAMLWPKLQVHWISLYLSESVGLVCPLEEKVNKR
jgi:hypothetical protein